MTSPLILNPTSTTLTKFIFDEEFQHWEATGELTELLNSLQIIAKVISAMVSRIGIADIFGKHDKGSDPKKLQNVANEIFINMLSSTNSVGILISEQNKKVINVDKNKKGKYIVAFDPLDGLSNIHVAISVGSIFGIMTTEQADLPNPDDAVNPRNKMVGAGYIVYGSSTIFVFSTGQGVNEFVLDAQVGEFLLVEKDIKIPSKSNIYSINEGYTRLWDDAIQEYIREKKFPSSKEKYQSRYVGTLVADVHRTLKQGGIFLYPANKEAPQGKLRVLYECKPMAFIIIAAGGMATDGQVSILEIRPTNIHQKTPLFIGSRDEVDELMEFLDKYRSK